MAGWIACAVYKSHSRNAESFDYCNRLEYLGEMVSRVKKNLREDAAPAYEIIDSIPRLKAVAADFQKDKAVAVDLEADSMYHFREKVCLIQMASPRANVLIDPLAIKDLSCLAPLFSNGKIKKIFHGADYDIRSLYRDFKFNIHNLFDTQIACMFLGIKETGLYAVLKSRFNALLDKKHQKKDWSQRPFPKEMTDYAVKDVIYLIPLANALEKELKKKNRLEWVYEECGVLSKVRSPVSTDREPLFIKFKGAGKLTSESLAVLEEILRYRYRMAERKDRPFYKIFSNEAVMKLTVHCPDDSEKLKACRALSEKQMQMYGDALIKSIVTAKKKTKSELPVYPRKKFPRHSTEVTKRIKKLKEWRDKKARALALAPGVLFSKSILTDIAKKYPEKIKDFCEIQDLRNWQIKNFGRDILEVLKQ